MCHFSDRDFKTFFLLDLRVASITVSGFDAISAKGIGVTSPWKRSSYARACAYIGQINGQIVCTVDWMQNSLGIEWSPPLCKFRSNSTLRFDCSIRLCAISTTNVRTTTVLADSCLCRVIDSFFSFFPPLSYRNRY